MSVRLYEPALGRFLSVDPVEMGSANDYDYCNGDPINCFDLGGDVARTKYPKDRDIRDLDCVALWSYIRRAAGEIKERDREFRANYVGYGLKDVGYRNHERQYQNVQNKLALLLDAYEDKCRVDPSDDSKYWKLAHKEHADLGHPGITYAEYGLLIAESYAHLYMYIG